MQEILLNSTKTNQTLGKRESMNGQTLLTMNSMQSFHYFLKIKNVQQLIESHSIISVQKRIYPSLKIGEMLMLFLQWTVKALVDLVGPSQQSIPLRLTMLLQQEREETIWYDSLNNNLLIVQEILITMDALEDYLLMLSLIFTTMVLWVLKIILIQLKMMLANIMRRKLQHGTLDHRISLKETNTLLSKFLLLKAQLL